MTIHAAKGLEFATVFVVGLEENIFPSPLAAISVRELEEERRLLYVAITRAEKHCILTNAKNRFRYGKMEFDNPSRFIDEIDASLIEGGEEAPESSFGGEEVHLVAMVQVVDMVLMVAMAEECHGIETDQSMVVILRTLSL